MKRVLTILVTLTLVMSLSVYFAAAASADSMPVIKVASATPLSGSQAAMGEVIKNGIELAYKERIAEFAALGFDLQFAPQDDQADPKVGVSIAQRLIEDKDFLAVVGHWNSGVAIPSSEVYNQGSLAMVSPANTATAVTDRALPVVNRICARDDAQGPAGADFLFSLGLTSVFIVQDKTTYGQGVADEFKKRFEAIGGAVLGYEGITAGEADYSAVEEMIRASGAQAVYFGGIYPEGGLMIRQLAEKGIAVAFLGPDGMDSAELVNIAGDAVIGTYYTSTAAGVANTDKGAAFTAAYEAAYGRAPEGYAAYGYDAMNVTLNAIKAAIEANGGALPTREQVVATVRATAGYEGVATNVTFNAIGDNVEAKVYVLGFSAAAYPAETIKSIAVTEFLK